MARFARHNDTAAQALLESRPASAQDAALAATVAGHFAGGTVDRAVARIGLGDVSIACEVRPGSEGPAGWSVPLYLRLWGGLLGPRPVFASINGYGATLEEAVTEGGALWAGAFGGVLRAGLAGLPDADPELRVFVSRLQGTPVRVAHAPVGRVQSAGPLTDAEQAAAIDVARTALTGGRSLTAAVLDWRGLPLVDLTHSALLSVLVVDTPESRTFEVKVAGDDVPAEGAFASAAPRSTDRVTVLRELAVVTRIGQRTA